MLPDAVSRRRRAAGRLRWRWSASSTVRCARWRRRDIKKLVAYQQRRHLGFCMLGLFALNAEGITGGVLQMINHGLSTGGLFLLVGMIYERYHTRQLDDLGGLAARLPLLAVFAGVHLAVEHRAAGAQRVRRRDSLSLAGMFKAGIRSTRCSGRRGSCWGPGICCDAADAAASDRSRSRTTATHHVGDMNVARSALASAPICVLCLWIGVRPQPLVDVIKPDVEAVAGLVCDRRASKMPALEMIRSVSDNG